MQLYGLNSVGLQRRGFPEEVRRELKRAYRLFFASSYNTTQALARARDELRALPEVETFLAVLRGDASAGSRYERRQEAADRAWSGWGASASTTPASCARCPAREMVGVYDADPGRAGGGGGGAGGARRSASLDALLERVDAAVVAVPTTDHARGGARGAGARRAPADREAASPPRLEEADRILARGARAGLLVATGHVERFNGALRACEPYLDEPRFIESHRLAPFSPRGTDVAVVLDLMIHDIDLVLGPGAAPGGGAWTRWACRCSPRAWTSPTRGSRFEGGAVANITASRVSRERMRKIRLFQPLGLPQPGPGDAAPGEFLRLREGAELGSPAARRVPPLAAIVERMELQGDGQEPLRAELEAFVAAVRGEGALVVSGEDGRRALAVALEIVRRGPSEPCR